MRKLTISVIAAIALFGGALASQASDTGQSPPNQVQDQAMLDDSGFGQALSGDNLGVESGRQETKIDTLNMQLSSSNLDGEVVGNSLSLGAKATSITGCNSVNNTTMSGFATVIQNSGNQVLIQNDLVVNMTVK